MSNQANQAEEEVSKATQPGDSKSTTQKLQETMGSGPEKAKEGGQSATQTAKDTASKASESASKMFGGGGGGGGSGGK